MGFFFYKQAATNYFVAALRFLGSLFQAIASYASKINLILINTQTLSLSLEYLSHQCELGLSTQSTLLLSRFPEAFPVCRNWLGVAKDAVILLCSSRPNSVTCRIHAKPWKATMPTAVVQIEKSSSMTSPSSTHFYSNMSAFLWQ